MDVDGWRNTGWFLEVGGARDLFAMIGAIGGYSADAKIAWRGHSSADFPLVSSMQRIPGLSDEGQLKARERALIDEAREWGLHLGADDRPKYLWGPDIGTKSVCSTALVFSRSRSA